MKKLVPNPQVMCTAFQESKPPPKKSTPKKQTLQTKITSENSNWIIFEQETPPIKKVILTTGTYGKLDISNYNLQATLDRFNCLKKALYEPKSKRFISAGGSNHDWQALGKLYNFGKEKFDDDFTDKVTYDDFEAMCFSKFTDQNRVLAFMTSLQKSILQQQRTLKFAAEQAKPKLEPGQPL